MDMIKHIGKVKNTDSRVLVVFMSLPDDKENALIVYTDGLTNLIQDELFSLIKSPECQKFNCLADFLKTRTLPSSGMAISILDWLHRSNKLVKLPTSNIFMTPHPSKAILLSELNKLMSGDSEGSKEQNLNPELSKLPKEELEKVAENLLIQAKVMREDAELAASQKEAEAKKILDSLKKVTKSKDKTTESVSAKKPKTKKTA